LYFLKGSFVETNVPIIGSAALQRVSPASFRTLVLGNVVGIKTILLALLHQSPAYFILSEREMDKKYPDILLLERNPTT
jgi:hypothetical protein